MTQGWIHDRDSGTPVRGFPNTHPKVDFVWGNMPMQPSDDRVHDELPLLAADDSHSISFTEWNGYPGNQPNAGRTLVDGGPYFYFPAVGLCNTGGFAENHLPTVIKELIACGVPEHYLTPAKFTGGTTWYDYQSEGAQYDETSGAIFYYYVSPTDTFGTNWQGKLLYGTDANDVVLYANYGPGQPSSPTSFFLVVFQSHTPALNTANWL